MIVAALLVASLLPIFFLYLVHTLDLYGTGSPRTLALCLLWGAVAAPVAALLHHALVSDWQWPAAAISTLWVAPPLEELLKALVLLYLLRRGAFTYFVDGAIYGFAAGIGFAVVENLFYLALSPQLGPGAAAARVLSTNLMHASASSMVGIALGLSRFRRFSGRALFLATGLALAILFHAAFNRLVLGNRSVLLLAYAIAAGLGGLAFVALAVQHGLAEQRRWIREKLGAADGVTAAEATAVDHLAHIDAILQPLTTLFGPEKTAQIEALLTLQAQLGIQRKTLERLDDPRQQEAALRRIEQLRVDMDAARRAVGAYTMTSLRLLFPRHEHALWSRLEATLQEQATNPGDDRPNLFTLAASRTQPRDETPQ
ncbi:MAG: PrsW family intramembrane metalloprotease [Chloroflexota bacterium]